MWWRVIYQGSCNELVSCLMFSYQRNQIVSNLFGKAWYIHLCLIVYNVFQLCCCNTESRYGYIDTLHYMKSYNKVGNWCNFENKFLVFINIYSYLFQTSCNHSKYWVNSKFPSWHFSLLIYSRKEIWKKYMWCFYFKETVPIVKT